MYNAIIYTCIYIPLMDNVNKKMLWKGLKLKNGYGLLKRIRTWHFIKKK